MLTLHAHRSFVNECGANQAAQDLCAEAEAAVADQEFVGATADDFNAFFGAETNFASIQAVVCTCCSS